MIVIRLQGQVGKAALGEVTSWVENQGFPTRVTSFGEVVGIAVQGSNGAFPVNGEGHPPSAIRTITSINAPYALASRAWKSEPTFVQVGHVPIGQGLPLVSMAGPCAVESWDQILSAARSARDAGAQMLRGGAYKPRTSPYSFQGLGEAGLELLAQASAATGLPVVSEVMAPEDVALVSSYVDMLQVGARNMGNFSLLQAVGRSKCPVLLKRGPSATLDEWLQAAEYILAGGNTQVVLCERGIRTFETATRNTLDLSIIPAAQSRTHLPIIADPSHGTGRRHLVGPMARAAVAAGADGLMLEMHPHPEEALSDAEQALSPKQLAIIIHDSHRVAGVCRPLAEPVPSETLV